MEGNGNATVSGVLSIPLIPHYARYYNSTNDNGEHHDRRRRRRHLGSSFSKVDALYQGYGTHYVDLWVGTPVPQRQTLIVDTGSSVTAFPCEGCRKSCGSGYHTDSYFKESDSRTFEVVYCRDCLIGRCGKYDHSCNLSASYQEGSSWKAFEVSDMVYSGGPHDRSTEDEPSFRMHFGCQTRVTGFFKTQLADGIMGMEMAASSFWKQMYNKNALREESFSLCMSRQPIASRSGTGAGAMTLGGVDERLHATPMVYANQLNTKGWFVVQIKRVFLRINGGERVQVPREDQQYVHLVKVDVSEWELNNGNVILDSGTTDTYLSSQIYREFNKAWRSLMGTSYDNKSHRYSDKELLALPTILFQLEAHDKDDGDQWTTAGLVGSLDKNRPTDVLVAMPPTHYMEYNPNTQRYMSRVYFNEKHGGVLGANFMMGHDVLFDAHRGRVGFAESSCDYRDLRR